MNGTGTLLTTGPVTAYPQVLRAMSTPLHYDYDPAFQEFYESVARKAQTAMGTDTPPLILQGEAVLGLEAAAASLIAADDVVLNLASGVYGKGFGFWAARYARRVDEIEVPYNDCIDPDAVSAHLAAHPETRIVSVCHHDTPSGTLNDINAIGAICAKAGALMIVDAVSSWAGMETSPDACQAAVYITGPNKCQGCPPGMTFVAISEAGWAKITANPTAPTASMLSLSDWKDAWIAGEPFPFTPTLPAIYGIDAALDLYLDEGPQSVWSRHARTAAATRAGLVAMGVSLWPARADIAAPTCTALKLPDGIAPDAVLKAAREHYGVHFAAGRGEALGQVIRIGHMGPMARPIYAHLAVSALGGALQLNGASVDIGAGLAATQHSIDTADGPAT